MCFCYEVLGLKPTVILVTQNHERTKAFNEIISLFPEKNKI
jgi:hypothetical protein